MLYILIPSMRQPHQLRDMITEIHENTKTRHCVYVSGWDACAAKNRNVCLDYLDSRGVAEPTAIMLDDDIRGFSPGWERLLMRAMDGPDVLAVSARLMTPEGLIAQTCSRCYELEPENIELTRGADCVMPTAAILFRHDPAIRFDENFKGSGFEDGDWFFQMLEKYPAARFIQNNACRLIHMNEMKGQACNWDFNLRYFLKKWHRRQAEARHVQQLAGSSLTSQSETLV